MVHKIRVFLTFCSLFLGIYVFSEAQVSNPAEWTFKTKAINDSVAELQMTVSLKPGWHLYSQKTRGTELPIEFSFEKNNAYTRLGGVQEPKAHGEYDKYAGDTSFYFEGKVQFRQRIAIKSARDFTVKGAVNYQLCEKGSCIPPDDVPFAFSVKGYKKAVSAENEGTVAIAESEKTADENVEVRQDDRRTIIAPETKTANSPKEKSNSPWTVFLVSFGAGLLTLITPCVFPMIPMTISFFLKGNKTRKAGLKQAFFFGGSIVFMFAVLGLLLTLLLGKDAMYIISTHWVPNVIFFVIFMIFALSFFGLFELTLPASWINKSDAQADKGGYVGAFFIALTTVLVSFSCTGPILGAALIELASGSNSSVVFLVSMIGFALGFAIPFTMFAMFPGIMKKMKSGSWLNTVKIVFGFVEIALGLKFLSMADLSANWGILDRETYLALWIVLFGMLGCYFLGKLRFKGDAPVEQISVFRLLLALASFSFMVYMIPGLWGAPLKAISGYVPPMTTQDFDIERIVVENSGHTVSVNPDALPAGRKHADKLHMPTGFNGFFDLDEAKAYAKQVNKPLFIDFTGKTCANCREMENAVWSDPEVKKILTQDYIMVALYVDANFIDLPEQDWVTTADGKVLKTLGRKNHNYQISTFHANAQPLYVLMDGDGKLLTEKPKAYDTDVQNFINFLNEGLSNFKNQ